MSVATTNAVSNTKSIESVNEQMKDDTPGVIGEEMFINTDQEDCLQDSLFDPAESVRLSDDNNPDVEVESVGSEELLSSLNNLSLVPTEEHLLDEDDDEEYLSSTSWLSKEKHVFILSESGKPIYSRYGKEDRLVTLYGLMQALVSFVADGDDVIRCINAGGHKFVFLIRSPLIFMAVSHSSSSVPQLTSQISYVHSQIISVLTSSTLTKMFEKRRNYDFRNLLGGTERLLDTLLDSFEHDPSFFLGSIQCLPLSNSVRDTITQTIVQNCYKIKNLVFALIISNNRLISLVRMKKFLLHPADLHLLFNLVGATESLKSCENWMPICLPKFDPKGYLYGHVSYLSDDCAACLILLSVDREQFFVLSEAKQKIVDKLRRQHCLEKINKALSSPRYTVQSVAFPQLRHFLYKSKSTAQFTSPVYTAPYNTKESQSHLFSLYQLLHHRIHSVSRPLKMMYYVTTTETLVGWVTKEFELYTALEPLVSRPNSITAVNNILQWIKSEENKLFILNSPTF